MLARIEPSWKRHLATAFGDAWFAELEEKVRNAYLVEQVFPDHDDVFRAFNKCPFGQVKVVILGQDPYHGDGQADGLCFSVRAPQPIPPSLRNIFKEMMADVGHERVSMPPTTSGDLSYLAEQGVLLLNSALTVRAHEPASHKSFGWEKFTDFAVKTLSDHREHLVFILWGAFARTKAPLIDSSKHLVLQAAHPSPLSAHKGFFGNRHFSKTNAYLTQHGHGPVTWLKEGTGL